MVNCLECDKEISKNPNTSWIDYEKRKFCNKKCGALHRITRVAKVCKECTRKFEVRRSVSERANYCSKSCRVKSGVGQFKKGVPSWSAGKKVPRGRLVSKSCSFCNKGIIVKRWRIKQENFCSTLCNNKFYSGRTPWNKGIGTISSANELARKSIESVKWRKAVFERDNYTCKKCKQRGGKLQADHIKPFAWYPELRFDLSNGRTLCIECHKKTPTYGRGSFKFKQHEKT